MDKDVSQSLVGPVRFGRAVVPAVRADPAARRVVAVALVTRLGLVGAGMASSTVLSEDPGTFVIGIYWALSGVVWLSATGLAKVALLAALDARERGAPISARAAFALAWARRRAIAGWVVTMRRFKDWWEPEAAFALPALATGDATDRAEAERRSVAIHRERWAFAELEVGTPTAIATTGAGVFFALAITALMCGEPLSTIGLVLAAILLVTALTAAALARAILALAIYRDHVDGTPPFGLTSGELKQLAAPKPGSKPPAEPTEPPPPTAQPLIDHGF
jgi:hypothetical protein